MEVHLPNFPKDFNASDFIPNLYSPTTILGTFGAASIVVFCLTWILSGLFSKTTKLEKLIICWLTFNGLIHLTLEFYLAFKPDFYKDKTGSFFAEIWKEYSKGDYRYLSLDSTTIALEAISIFIFGPTNLLAAYAVATHKTYRYAIQLVVSSMEVYSVVIYYMTAFIEGNQVSASPYYYYAYFILANFPWVIIPSLVIIISWRKVCGFDGANKSKVH